MLDKMKKAPAALAVVVMTVFGSAFAASAQTYQDPTGGAAGDIKDDVISWVTTQGIPLLVALLGLGVAIALLIKFVRKGRSTI